jgi:hypothetical protein
MKGKRSPVARLLAARERQERRATTKTHGDAVLDEPSDGMFICESRVCNIARESMSRSLSIALLLSLSTPAWAYLDPGTGSMILQGLIAGIAVAGLTIKTYWYKLRSLFGKQETGSLLEEESLGTDPEESPGAVPEEK